MRPRQLKFGVALALSFAGFLYYQIRTRRMRQTSSSSRFPSPSPPSGDGNKFDTDGRADLKDDLRSLQEPLCSCDDASCTAHVFEESSHQKFTNDDNVVGFSPRSKYSGEEEELQLPKFKEFVLNDFELTLDNAGISEEVDTAVSSKVAAEKEETDQEIINMRNMVKVLQDREKNLEIQLLEYYGLKQKETAMTELQNRLKLSNMEAKLYNLKIESLQAEKQRLEAQVADHARVVTELETARGKIRTLKRKLRSDEEKKKELLSSLKQSVANLREQEMLNDANIHDKMQRLKELEDESAELKKANSRTQQENSELARRLESTQILASSILEDPGTELLREANSCLTHENEELKKELERLRVDCCADVEELVYLRWVNSCFRYELRNYQPPPGTTMARDLSKTLSPESEEKAKHLILEYANSEGFGGDKVAGFADFDYDHCSSSQASDLTDSGEYDDIHAADVSSATKSHTSSKTKLLRRFKTFVLGKDNRTSSVGRNSTSFTGSGKKDSASTTSFEDNVGTHSCDTLSSHHISSANTTPQMEKGARSTGGQSTQNTPSQGSSRPSFDIQRLRNLHSEDIKDGENIRRNSDVGSSFGYKRMVMGENGAIGLSSVSELDQDDPDAREKLELINFAEVLRSSRRTPNSRKSTAICS